MVLYEISRESYEGEKPWKAQVRKGSYIIRSMRFETEKEAADWLGLQTKFFED